MLRRILFIAIPLAVVIGALFFFSGAFDPGQNLPPPTVEVSVVQKDLSIPWDVAFAPDGRMFVSERPGRIRVYASGEPGAELLATVEVDHTRAVGESGVMGMAFDRDFERFPFLYVCASRDEDGEDGDSPWINQLLRYRVSDDGLTLEGPVFTDPIRANRMHNGCAVEMDDEYKIWMTTGDSLRGEAGWPQDPAQLNGKVLRLNRDGSVPDDNPIFDGMDDPTFVYSIGHRNSQGLGFDPVSGDVFTAEHGTFRDDEINRITAGGNRGWACYTGNGNVNERLESGCGPAEDYLPPSWTSGESTLATSGLAFLSGSQWGAWEGNIIVSCLKERDLRRFTLSATGDVELVETLLDERFGRLRAAVLGPDGALYITTSNAPNASRKGAKPVPEEMADFVIRIEPVAG
jgi:glucose/arabinose dehydrogenase